MTLTYSRAVRDIHIIKAQVGLDDDAYRDVVEAITGRRSVQGLPVSELEKVLVALRRFQTGGGRPPTRRDQHSSSQSKIIPHLMEYLGWNSWKPVAELCKRITGVGDTRKCDSRDLRKVIAAMVAMVQSNHNSGKRVLTHTQMFEFRRFTHSGKHNDRGTSD